MLFITHVHTHTLFCVIPNVISHKHTHEMYVIFEGLSNINREETHALAHYNNFFSGGVEIESILNIATAD